MTETAQLRHRLLTEFERLFLGRIYRHRASTQGDRLALEFYEDLISIRRSQKLLDAVRRDRVVYARNVRRGIKARRGDGAFGELIPGEAPLKIDGFEIPRGPIATLEIGVEVKILATAMLKQIGRVTTVLRDQVAQFRRGGDNPICVGIVGINQAEAYTSHEGDKPWPTGAGGRRHPIQEAATAEQRLREEAASDFDEFLILRFRATNAAPFPFEWINFKETQLDYGAALARVAREYQQRF